MRPSVRQFQNVEPSKVYDEAESALRSEGFRIAQSDRAGGRITAFPLTAATGFKKGGRPIRLSSASRTRWIAIIRIIEADGVVNISCGLEQQEMVTEAHRMFEQQLGGFDRADDTPIDRGAAATLEQNTAWKTTSHDRRGEHRILTAIERALDAPSNEPAKSGVMNHSP